MLEKRKAAVLAKEQTSLERLQEKRDAAVSAIATVMGMHKKPLSASPVVEIIENGVDVPHVEEKTSDDVLVTVSNGDGTLKSIGNVNVEVKSYPGLVKLCQEMNSEGLHKFISDNQKDLVTLREEIPVALRAACNPASLALDSLKGFYGSDVSNSDAKKDSNLIGLPRTCIMLMEHLCSLILNLDVDSLSIIVLDNAQERAKAIAEEWKPKLDILMLMPAMEIL